jgi:hypothetical protein
MPFCTQCGSGAQPGARYCARCGHAVAGPDSGFAPPPATAPPAAPAPPPALDTATAQTLLLVGALLNFLLPLAIALAFLGLGAFAALFPFGAIAGALFAVLALVVLLVGGALAAGALHARNELRRGDVERGGTLAILVGVLMLVTGGLVSGVLVLAGGVLARGARHA